MEDNSLLKKLKTRYENSAPYRMKSLKSKITAKFKLKAEEQEKRRNFAKDIANLLTEESIDPSLTIYLEKCFRRYAEGETASMDAAFFEGNLGGRPPNPAKAERNKKYATELERILTKENCSVETALNNLVEEAKEWKEFDKWKKEDALPLNYDSIIPTLKRQNLYPFKSNKDRTD